MANNPTPKMQEAVSTYIKFIPYFSLDLWDVKKNRIFEDKETSKFQLVKLKHLLTQVKRTENVIPNVEYKLLGVKSYGLGVFHREVKKGSEIKAKYLWILKEGDFVYSRLGASGGSFGLINKEFCNYYVSNEFPTFIINIEKVNPQFLNRVLTSKRVYERIKDFNTGSALKRFHEDEFLDIEIPLPSIAEQERIIDAYLQKIEQAKRTKKETGSLEEEIEKYLFDALGYKINSSTDSKKKGSYLRLINYSVIDKWGADQNNSNNLTLTKSFEVKKIKDICTVSSGGTPSRDRKEYYTGNIPWIKTGEVVNDVIYDTEEKITKEAIENSSAKIYPKGSLIIAMYGQGLTRGRTAKLGIDASTNQACAVLFNINNQIVLTDFLWIYLIGEYNRLRELASGNNQPNLNAQMIKDYNIVIPPLYIQEEIIKNYSSLKSKVKSIESEYEKLISIAEIAFEKEIFG